MNEQQPVQPEPSPVPESVPTTQESSVSATTPVKPPVAPSVRPTAPYPQPPAKDRSHMPWLIGCGVIFLLCFITVVSFIGLMFYVAATDKGADGTDNGGADQQGSSQYAKVKMVNELSKEDLAFMDKEGLLSPGEQVDLYYDVWQDESEVMILTDREVIYDSGGHISRMALSEIDNVQHYQEKNGDSLKDVYILHSTLQQRMKIEIYEGEGAKTFERELDAARKTNK